MAVTHRIVLLFLSGLPGDKSDGIRPILERYEMGQTSCLAAWLYVAVCCCQRHSQSSAYAPRQLVSSRWLDGSRQVELIVRSRL